MERLRSLLAASDADAQEAFQELETAVAGVVDRGALDALNETINNFEFDQALARLDDIEDVVARFELHLDSRHARFRLLSR